ASAVAVTSPIAAMAASPRISFLRNFSSCLDTIWFSGRSYLLLALLGDRRLHRLARCEVEVALCLPGARALLGRHDQGELLLALLEELLRRGGVDRPDRGIR